MDKTDSTSRIYDQLQVLERADRPLEPKARLQAVIRPLLAWYESHARVLPWREDASPYRVWISEIMLQQTRVEAVIPYFERFLKELPDVAALAAVEDDRLMKLWEGLGYYNRARNLKKAAQLVMERFDGEIPSSCEKLLTLPGIGSYTAGAVSSIAYGRAAPAVDGNVLRVISRVLASREDILKQSVRRRMEQLLGGVIPEGRASQFNQGLIEIGAIVCVPNGRPRCEECPLASLCLARKQGLTEVIPVRKPAKKRRIEERTVCILEEGGNVGLHKRDDTGLLASLYELPNVEGHLSADELEEAFSLEAGSVAGIERLPDAKHIFSHVEWHMVGYRVLLDRALPKRWMSVPREDLKAGYPLPNAFGKYVRLI